jgi:hypothetical protein
MRMDFCEFYSNQHDSCAELALRLGGKMIHIHHPCHAFGRQGAITGLLIAAGIVLFSTFAFAQAPVAQGGTPTAMLSEAQLDKLVGPIALYPDDLIGIVLPAATYPLQIVQADRFLDKRKSNKNLPIDEAWHESVKALVNYPEVVKKMSVELDWTTNLGNAVIANQGAVLEAIQRFRRLAQSAGNLKSDSKQVIVIEKEIIKIVPADPQVIYVPQYSPATVVVYGGNSSLGYLPTPYPVYYYPYPPGAAFATGLIWGAAISSAWNGNHYVTHYGHGSNNTINVNQVNVNNANVNRANVNTATVNRANVNSAKAGSANVNSAQSNVWQSEKRPGQASSTTSQGSGGASGYGTARQSNPSSTGGEAFGGYGSGNQARAASQRGTESRHSMSGTGGGPSNRGGNRRLPR